MIRYIVLLTLTLLLSISCSGGSEPETAQVPTSAATATIAQNTPTPAPIPTATPALVPTTLILTETPAPTTTVIPSAPTPTSVPPTATPVPPSPTLVPTATPVPPSPTPVPPSPTPVPPAPTPVGSATVTILNYSSYETSVVKNLVDRSTDKMKSRESNILVYLYDIGAQKIPEQPIRSDYADKVFSKHEVLMTQDKIDKLLAEIETWLKNDSCYDTGYLDIDAHLSDYRAWLEQGGDASTQHTVCPMTRVVALGFPKTMREVEPFSVFQNLVVHEMYHALQQDLMFGQLPEEDPTCEQRGEMDNSNSVWFIEGGAHYFSTLVVAEVNNTTNPQSQILGIAREKLVTEGLTLYGSGPDIAGAAALRLMIERGTLTEEAIMDGSLFHSCARELVYDSSSAEIQHIRASWKLIEKQGSLYTFTQEALKP